MGCRSLSDSEIQQVINSFTGEYALRDKALFVLGLRTGFRVSELLSLTVKQVIENGEPLDHITVQRRFMKMKFESRSVVVHPQAKEVIQAWVRDLQTKETITPDTYLFKSRSGKNRPLTRVQAHRILKHVFKNVLGLKGALATHSMRKTFAQKVYEKLNHDLFKTAAALSHKDINNTVRYLSLNKEEVEKAILDV